MSRKDILDKIEQTARHPVQVMGGNNADEPVYVFADHDSLDPMWVEKPGVHKFGQNPTTSAGEDIWFAAGVYAGFIAAASDCTIVSTQAADDAVGGAGARTVEIQGLDANGALQTVVANMDGAVPVAIGNWYRIFRMIVLTDGGTNNVGVLTAATTPGGVTLATIGATIGQTLQALYTIPTDYPHGHMVSLYASMQSANAAARSASMMLQARPFGGSWATKETWDIHTYSGVDGPPMDHALQYEPLTDLRVRCNIISNDNNLINAGFNIKFTEH